MGERKERKPLPKRTHQGLVRDPSERENDLQSGQRSKRHAEKSPAGRDLLRRRLVLRRNAAHGVDDGGVDQRQAVVGTPVIDPRSEAVTQQASRRAGRRHSRP